MVRKAEEEKARVKQTKQAQKLSNITTINELEDALCKLELEDALCKLELEDALCKAGGTTTKQVEAAKISILKHQLEVPLNLCGKRLTLSHKRQKKISEDLLRELTALIEEEEEKRLKERESALPESLNGKTPSPEIEGRCY